MIQVPNNKMIIKKDLIDLLVFTDICPSCEHLVAEHEYTFRVEGKYQVIIQY